MTGDGAPGEGLRPASPLRIAPIEAPTLASVKPLPPDERPALEPYRVLFPAGAAFAILGVLPWILAAFGAGPWPGPLHAGLMIQGFELCFVAGFLLTAMPAFTHGAKCRGWELAAVAAGAAAFGALHVLNLTAAAGAAFALTLSFTMVTVGRRVRLGGAAPPEEFLLVGVGLLFGVAGGVLQALAASGLAAEPTPRFALRLVSRGMMPALVLGLGGLLVPTFAMMKEPLAILAVARAGQRAPRRAFVLAIAALLVAAFAFEARGGARPGAWVRAAAALASTMLAWKLWRRPGRNDRLAWGLWAAGWCVALGLLAAAALPSREVTAWHLVFVGGYGLLTLAIATRVVVSHGGHEMREEGLVLGAGVVAGVGLALVLRLASDGASAAALRGDALAALAWATAWGLWLAAAWPRVRRTKRRMMMPSAPERSRPA
jgi:uncharacterized protein involved in response to NO